MDRSWRSRTGDLAGLAHKRERHGCSATCDFDREYVRHGAADGIDPEQRVIDERRHIDQDCLNTNIEPADLAGGRPPFPRSAFVARDRPVMLVADECESGNHLQRINLESAAACSGRIRNSKDSDSDAKKQCVYNVMAALT